MTRFDAACAALRRAADLEIGEIDIRRRAVMDALGGAKRSELTTAAAALIALVEHPDPRVAGEMAITLGAFVEEGLPAERVGVPIVRRAKRELVQARAFHEALVRESERHEETEDALYGGDYAVPLAVSHALADEMPREAHAYDSLDALCVASIACLTRSSALRASSRVDVALVEATRPFRHDVGHCLHDLLVGVAKAEWLVLHATERKGFMVRVREINDNWVIQPLLAAALLDVREGGIFGLGARQVGLAGGLTGTPPPPGLVACLRGEGSQRLELSARGLWEAYTWRAVQPGGRLREGLLEHRIWNEGIPLDIPELDGTRVVVLGPEMVRRSWRAQRTHSALGSNIEHVRTLSRVEVDQWLRRCAFESLC